MESGVKEVMDQQVSVLPPEILNAIEGGDISVLLAILVQFTGDRDLLSKARPYINGPWDYLVDMPEALDAEIRARLVEVMSRGGARDPSEISRDLLGEIMSTVVGGDVPDEYVDMLSRDIGCSDNGAAATRVEKAQNFKVAVIGAGLSGICAAIELDKLGFAYEVFEKNDEVGGTWYENTYPGCGVDTPNHFYSFSFELHHRWTQYFAKRDEIFGYLRGCAEKYGILPHIRFKTEVLEAAFDEESAIWSLRVRDESGVVHMVEANAVIFGVGGLTRAAFPDIDGIDGYSGTLVHTAAWDQNLDLTGKRVAVIGTGASAMQAVPEIAKIASQLTVYQRSPQWVTPNPNYHRAVPEGKKLALEHLPFYARWYRFQLFWGGADAVHPTLKVDPNWPTPNLSLNEKNEEMRQRLVAHIQSELADRPDLLSKAIPTYPPYGKRMLRDNNWFTTMKRDNVDLVTDPIVRFTPTGILAGGKETEFDVVVCATGFNTHESLAPIVVRGRDGVSIRDIWGSDDPRAYYGVTVPQFPNMFILFGPNTILAHGGSAIFQTETQVNYILQGLKHLVDADLSVMECRNEPYEQYNEKVDAAHSQMVWAHSGVNNWYRNEKGRVTMATPWRMVDYWSWMSELDLIDYKWS